MKTTVQLVNNKHSVVVFNGSEERLYFVSEHGLHTAQAVEETLRRDISRHGDDVIEVDGLPLVQTRVNARGNTVRYTA